MSKEREIPLDVLFVGPSGSGKSRLAGLMAERKEMSIIDTGQVLRDIAADENHPFHQVVSYHLKEGVFIGPELLNEVLVEELRIIGEYPVVFDGSVRDLDQLDAFNDLMKSIDRDYVSVSIKADLQNCISRLLARGRSDDYYEMVMKRIDYFQNNTIFAIEELKKGSFLEVVNDGDMEVEDIIGLIEAFLSLNNTNLSL